MDDEVTKPDAVKSILAACERACTASERAAVAAEAARDAAEKSAAVALQKVQEKHDLLNVVQSLRWRVEKWELIHLPIRVPWLSLVVATVALVLAVWALRTEL